MSVRIEQVLPADPDLLDRNPVGYRLEVLHVFSGRDVPAHINVSRAAGCNTLNLKLGGRLVVAISSAANLNISFGADPGYGPDNYNSAWYKYNSAWYKLEAGSRLRLEPESSWIVGLGRVTTIPELLQATGLPRTDVASIPSGADPQTALEALAAVLAAAAAVFVWRRTSVAGAIVGARRETTGDLV